MSGRVYYQMKPSPSGKGFIFAITRLMPSANARSDDISLPYCGPMMTVNVSVTELGRCREVCCDEIAELMGFESLRRQFRCSVWPLATSLTRDPAQRVYHHVRALRALIPAGLYAQPATEHVARLRHLPFPV